MWMNFAFKWERTENGHGTEPQSAQVFHSHLGGGVQQNLFSGVAIRETRAAFTASVLTSAEGGIILLQLIYAGKTDNVHAQIDPQEVDARIVQVALEWMVDVPFLFVLVLRTISQNHIFRTRTPFVVSVTTSRNMFWMCEATWDAMLLLV